MDRILTYTAAKDGETVKDVLKQHFKMSSTLIKQLKRTDDAILVNNSPARVDRVLNPNDMLTLTMHEKCSENIEPIKSELKIVYEDEDIIIIDKPSGMPTHPSAGNYSNTLANALMYYFNSKGEEHTFRAVNRLDKYTSGLLCVAKNAYAHARLCETLHTDFIRRYTAAVCGNIACDGEVIAPIGRCADSVIKRCILDSGKYAKTKYRVLSHFDDCTLVELTLETGRTHQIRVHMAHIGHPLLGDWLYGTESDTFRVALHSSYLSLIHPVTNKMLEFYSDVAEDVHEFFRLKPCT